MLTRMCHPASTSGQEASKGIQASDEAVGCILSYKLITKGICVQDLAIV